MIVYDSLYCFNNLHHFITKNSILELYKISVIPIPTLFNENTIYISEKHTIASSVLLYDFKKYIISVTSLIIVPIVAKTIREDGETQFIDINCDPSKTLLIPLIPKTTIQRTHLSCNHQSYCRFLRWEGNLWPMLD